MKKYPMPSESTRPGAVILADGLYPAEGLAARILSSSSMVVCCDGAADSFILHGGEPGAIVGDCDSVSPSTRQRYADIVFCDPDQECNDLTKAFRFCLSEGIDDIVIVGATGRREDHTLANLSLLAEYARQAQVCMITPSGVFNAIYGPSCFDSFPGQQVSIFTISTDTPLEVEGLLYTPPADGLCSWWRGSLNQSTGKRFEINTAGPTLVFRTFSQ